MPKLSQCQCSYRLLKHIYSFDKLNFMTSNVNFDVRPISQLFVFVLRAVSQPLNRKIQIQVYGPALKTIL